MKFSISSEAEAENKEILYKRLYIFGCKDGVWFSLEDGMEDNAGLDERFETSSERSCSILVEDIIILCISEIVHAMN